MAKDKKFNPNKRGNGKKDGKPRDGEKDPKNLKIKENDISWYTKYPTLIGPNASINFNLRYGSKVPTVKLASQPSVVQGVVETTIPGIIMWKYIPMYADSADVSSAVNVAAKNAYTYIRHANSGSVNYETSDLMQYFITVMNLITQVEQIKRDLRIVHTYNAQNKYIGMFTLSTLHNALYANSMLTNSATLTGQLNVVIGKLNSFKIPKDIALLDRHLWLSSNIFRDDELVKYTQYIADTDIMAHYDWQNQTVKLEKKFYNDAALKIAAINAEIDNLLSYEDIGIMIGDILKAYKAEGCRVISPIQLGEILEPSYSRELINQFRNITVPGNLTSTHMNYDVKQVSGNSQIIYAQQDGSTSTNGEFKYEVNQVGVPFTHEYFNYYQTLVVDSDNPTPEEVILNSRMSLNFVMDSFTGGQTFVVVSNYCSELSEFLCVASFDGDPNDFNGDELVPTLDKIYSLSIIGDFPDLSNALQGLQSYVVYTNQMHKATGTPGYSVLFDYNDGGINYSLSNYYNGKNVITLSDEWLKRLHDACKLSLWTMPMFKLLEN